MLSLFCIPASLRMQAFYQRRFSGIFGILLLSFVFVLELGSTVLELLEIICFYSENSHCFGSQFRLVLRTSCLVLGEDCFSYGKSLEEDLSCLS